MSASNRERAVRQIPLPCTLPTTLCESCRIGILDVDDFLKTRADRLARGEAV
jgi:hypothetical protein